MSHRPSCAILVLNWNGRAHLEHLLPSLRAAVAHHGGNVPVIVVDNRSTDPDVEYVRSSFPEMEVVVAEANDFLFSLNPIVAARTEDVVVILNNDMRVEPDFLAPLLAPFADDDIFAVTANVLDWEGTRRTTGRRAMAVSRFFFRKWWADLNVTSPCHTLDAGGGCSAYHRARFVELGGYDQLYRPGYYEDIDLSWRAWMHGWRIVFDPASTIYHRVGATMWDRTRESRMIRLLRRNEALFTIKNVGGWGFATAYFALLPVRIVRNLVGPGNRDLAMGLLAAIPRLGLALRGRLARPAGATRTVREIEAALAEPVHSPRFIGAA